MREVTSWRSPALLLAWGLFVCLAACGDTQKDPHAAGSTKGNTVFATNGARIYYTARSSSGNPILVSSSFGEPGHPPTKACVDCHGSDGEGVALETDDGFEQTPAITYARLTSPSAYREGRVYDDATLALTLRSGVRIDGHLLDTLMPRWQISNADMSDLIAHLKTLGSGPLSKEPR